MKNDFQLAHDYFKRIFSGNNPLTKKYSIKDFPDVNKLVVITSIKKKVSKKK